MFCKALVYLLCFLMVLPGYAGEIRDTVNPPGQTEYIRVFTGPNTSMAAPMSEGTSGGVGYYRVTNTTLLSNSMPGTPGEYPFKLFLGTPSTTANDTQVGAGSFRWSGTDVLDPDNELLTDLDQVRLTTDNLYATPSVSGTPFVAGPAALGQEIVTAPTGPIVFMGDSIVFGFSYPVYQVFSRTGIRGFGQGGRWNAGGSLGGVFTGDTTVNDYADPLDFGTWMAEVDFAGGTSNASATDNNNRMLYLGKLGPSNGVAADAYADSASQAVVFGNDFIRDTLAAGRPIEVRVPVLMTPNGTTLAHTYIAIREGATIIGTSPFFSTYSATPHWEYKTATIPAGTYAAFTFLQGEIRYRNSTATEAGKTSYFSAHWTVIDPTIATGEEIHLFGQGGATVDDFANTATWGDVPLSVLGLIKPRYIIIPLGLNDSSGANAANFTTDLLAMVARLRAVAPDARIVFVSPHPRVSYGPNYGGEGTMPYYVAGAYNAHLATSNSAFINMTRMFPKVSLTSAHMYSDGEVHLDIEGNFMFQNSLMNGLRMLSYTSGAATIAQTVRNELGTELARVDMNIGDVPDLTWETPSTTPEPGSFGEALATMGVAAARIDDTLEDNGGTYRFSADALAEAPTSESATAGGLSFVVYVGSVDPDRPVTDVVQGETKQLTFVVQARGSFATATPTAITVKFKDEEGNLVTVANGDIDRITEDFNFQVFRLSLTGVSTATLQPGYLSVEITIDTEKAQVREGLRVVEAL